MTQNLLFIALILFVFSSVAQETPSVLLAPKNPPKGNAIKPDVGIHALMLYQNSNRGNKNYTEIRNGFELQETELILSADLDSDWHFQSAFAIRQEVAVDNTTTPPTRSAEWIFEPEELFAETLSLPWTTLRVGKFRAAFGRHNRLHAHAFPFIDAPLAHQILLGDEGLNDSSLSASGMLPTPWFSEVTYQLLSGQGEGLEYFKGPSANDSISLLNWNNFWDLSSELSMELGGSGATGRNSFQKTTTLLGADLTFKWRANRSHAVAWSTEYLKREQEFGSLETGEGFASWIRYQMATNWWVQIRGEYLKLKNQSPTTAFPAHHNKQSILIGFKPSNLSNLRLQYDHLEDGANDPEQKIMLQLQLAIESNSAHTHAH